MAFHPQYPCSFILDCEEEPCPLPSLYVNFTVNNGVTECPLRSLHWCLPRKACDCYFCGLFWSGFFFPLQSSEPCSRHPSLSNNHGSPQPATQKYINHSIMLIWNPPIRGPPKPPQKTGGGWACNAAPWLPSGQGSALEPAPKIFSEKILQHQAALPSVSLVGFYLVFWASRV